jgi:hypothetical protein
MNISKKEKADISLDLFNEFKLERVLMKYDFPLLILMISPEGKKWLFNWCANDENAEDENINKTQEIIEQWMAFEISPAHLENFLSGHISLREIILLCEFDFYLMKTKDFPKPFEIIKTYPEKIPKEYLPKYDITLDGKIDRLPEQVKDIERFNLSVHLISEEIQLGEIPLSIAGPFQDYFQKYIHWASHNIENKDISEVYIPANDWTTINMDKCGAGSFVMFWSCPEKNPEKIKIFQESCRILHEILNISEEQLDIEKYVQKIGKSAIDNIQFLLRLISNHDLSINLKWTTENKEELFLIINKRMAEIILNKFTIYNKKVLSNVTLSIKLTPEEIRLLQKPVIGRGGHQSFLRRIQTKLHGNILKLEPYDVDMMIRYAQNYGEGGFQGRYRAVLNALKRMGVTFANIK